MARTLDAVIVGANRASREGQALALVPEATVAAGKMHAFLSKRFHTSLAPPLVDDQATLKAFKAALNRGKKLKPGDIFVISFSGHGSEEKNGQGWCFVDGVFTDFELAVALNAMPKGVEIVVVSDCCYALGLFKPGLQKVRLRALARTTAFRLKTLAELFAKKTKTEPASFIILAAASVVGAKLGSFDFISLIISSVSFPNRPRYLDLRPIIENNSNGTVDAMPQTLLKLLAFKP